MRNAIAITILLLALGNSAALAAPGDTLWTRTFGGSSEDVANSVQQTTDGGYIIAGYTNSGYGNYDFYLVKTDTSGNALWTRTYGGSSND